MSMHRHAQTEHIVVETRLCEACGDCISACPKEVLGMVSMLWHRHVRVDHAALCIGCGKCVAACSHGAIKATS